MRSFTVMSLWFNHCILITGNQQRWVREQQKPSRLVWRSFSEKETAQWLWNYLEQYWCRFDTSRRLGRVGVGEKGEVYQNFSGKEEDIYDKFVNFLWLYISRKILALYSHLEFAGFKDFKDRIDEFKPVNQRLENNVTYPLKELEKASMKTAKGKVDINWYF